MCGVLLASFISQLISVSALVPSLSSYKRERKQMYRGALTRLRILSSIIHMFPFCSRDSQNHVLSAGTAALCNVVVLDILAVCILRSSEVGTVIMNCEYQVRGTWRRYILQRIMDRII